MFLLDRGNGLTYTAQIQRQAMAQLAAGRLRHGDRLPSVRQFARSLRVSRTTAERIHGALCDAMVAEVRPRSGTYVASSGAPDQIPETARAREIYAFLKATIQHARNLGLEPAQFGKLIGTVAVDPLTGAVGRRMCFPVVDTREGFECLSACLPRDLAARFVHLSPSVRNIQGVLGLSSVPYLLSTYSNWTSALTIAKALNVSVVCVRCNVKLLDRVMNIQPGEVRCFVTRDADHAEATRVFVASAYPEVSATRYTIVTADEWLRIEPANRNRMSTWATITASAFLRNYVDSSCMHLLHPVVAEDFIDELRCYALFG